MGKTYTVKQVAEILGYSTNSIYTFLKEGRIKGVRVGRGRFRVPEEELARVLHLSKRPSQEQRSVVTTQVPQGTPTAIAPDLTDSIMSSPAAVTLIGKSWGVPNVFDWMVGLGAILSGMALFLFNQSYQSSSSQAFAHAAVFARWILIASGTGVIASSIRPNSVGWRRFFQAMLAVMGLVNASLLFRSGDLMGTAIYGSLALLVAVNVFVPLEGALSVSLYYTILAVTVPLCIYFGQNDIQIKTLLTYLDIPHATATVAVSLVSVLSLMMFWTGYVRTGFSFWIICGLVAMGLILSSVYSAMLVFWSRSFFLLTTAIALGFLPFFKNCGPACSPRQRVLLHSLFALAGGIMLVSLIIVTLLQQSVWEQNEQEFINKTSYGQTVLVQSLESVQSTLITASKNPELIGALATDNAVRLEELSKVIYEGNPNIRRLVFVNRDGLGTALYPHGAFDDRNLGFRDYFIQTRDTRKPYVSQLFTALVDNASRKVVSIAVPVESEEKEFVGVMVGSVDLVRIGSTLQRIAIGTRKETYLVADAEGKLIIAMDPELVGTVLSEDDPLWRATRGEQGVEFAKLTDGTLGMVTYAPVSPYGWGLSLRAPASRVYTLNQAAIYTIFGIISSVFVLSVVWLLLMRVHIRVGSAP